MKARTYNPKKTSVIETLSDLLAKAKSVAIIDFTGLKVSQATDLRKQIKAAGGQYVVAKNTLFKIALSKSRGRNEQSEFNGPAGFVFSLTDEVSALKPIAEFSKKNQMLTFKSGLLGDRVLTAAEVQELSAVPDRQTSLAQLVFNLNWNIGQLVRTLDAVAKSKEVTS